MANTVPYEGAPTREPSFRPTPEININTPPAAFGTNIAEAIQRLGQVQEGAGKELFDRAYAMRELQAHANASAALSDMQNKQLQASEDFRRLEGKAAVDAYPALQTNLDAIREGGRRGLSPYEQMLYDGESRSSTFNEKFYAAKHAGDEQKKYLLGTAKASTEASINSIEAQPDNDAAFKASIANIRKNAQHQADIGGLPVDDPQRKLLEQKDVSSAYERRIYGLAENGHIKEAQDLFNEATASKDLVSSGIDMLGRTSTQRLQAFINEKRNTIGARHTASEVMSGKDIDYWLGRTLSDNDILNGLKSAEAGSYSFIGPEVSDKEGHRGRALGHYGVMTYSLQGFLRNAGMPEMSVDQFLADPAAQDKLAILTFRSYIDKYGNAGAVKAWFGGPGSAKLAFSQLYDVNMDGNRYARNFVSGVAHGASTETTVQAVKDHAQKQFPGDSEFEDAAVSRAMAIKGVEDKIRRDTEFDNFQAISSALNGDNSANKPPTTEEELRAFGGADVGTALDWFAKNDPDKIRSVRAILEKNAKGPSQMSADQRVEYNKLHGMSVDDPEGFLQATDDMSYLTSFPQRETNSLIEWRKAAVKNLSAHPRVAQALGELSDIIPQDLRDDKDNFNLFKGMLGGVMSDYIEVNGKPMPYDEIRRVGTKLLQKVGEGKWFSSPRPWFEGIGADPNYLSWAAELKKIPEAAKLSDSQIQQIYVQQMFNPQLFQQLYGKKTSSPTVTPGK